MARMDIMTREMSTFQLDNTDSIHCALALACYTCTFSVFRTSNVSPHKSKCEQNVTLPDDSPFVLSFSFQLYKLNALSTNELWIK